MTVPAPELQRFLADLTQRRARLDAVVGSADDALARELTELGETLVIADEELRVQAEELEDVRRRLEETAVQRALAASLVAGLLTSRTGVLVEANAAALRLADQTPPRQLRRPVATWFAVHDRPTVRSMITGITRGSLREVRADLLLRRRDGATVPVEVAVEPVGSGEQALLRWTLRSARDEPEHELVRLVADRHGAQVDDLLAQDLAGLALDLAEATSADAVLTNVVGAVTGLVPGADEVALTLLQRGAPELSRATGPAAAELQACELALRRGPGCDVVAMGGGASLASPDLAHDPRWVEVAPASLEVGLRSNVSVCVALPGVHRTALLSCYGAPGAMDDDARQVAVLVAAHVGVALDRILTETSLRAALETRQQIGEAVGVLVERERLGPGPAFARLVERSQRENRLLREVARELVEEAARSSAGADQASGR